MADRPPSIDPGPGKDSPGARLPALTPAGRELLEVLWSASRPLTTRQLQDAIARRFPRRAGRKIQTISTLLAELMAQGWVAGEKRGGTRWVYRPAVSRIASFNQRVVYDLLRPLPRPRLGDLDAVGTPLDDALLAEVEVHPRGTNDVPTVIWRGARKPGGRAVTQVAASWHVVGRARLHPEIKAVLPG